MSCPKIEEKGYSCNWQDALKDDRAVNGTIFEVIRHNISEVVDNFRYGMPRTIERSFDAIQNPETPVGQVALVAKDAAEVAWGLVKFIPDRAYYLAGLSKHPGGALSFDNLSDTWRWEFNRNNPLIRVPEIADEAAISFIDSLSGHTLNAATNDSDDPLVQGLNNYTAPMPQDGHGLFKEILGLSAAFAMPSAKARLYQSLKIPAKKAAPVVVPEYRVGAMESFADDCAIPSRILNRALDALDKKLVEIGHPRLRLSEGPGWIEVPRKPWLTSIAERLQEVNKQVEAHQPTLLSRILGDYKYLAEQIVKSTAAIRAVGQVPFWRVFKRVKLIKAADKLVTRVENLSRQAFEKAGITQAEPPVAAKKPSSVKRANLPQRQTRQEATASIGNQPGEAGALKRGDIQTWNAAVAIKGNVTHVDLNALGVSSAECKVRGVIGRMPNADASVGSLAFPGDPLMSRTHADFVYDYRSRTLTIRDLSTNGTSLNGAPISKNITVTIPPDVNGVTLRAGGQTIFLEAGVIEKPAAPAKYAPATRPVVAEEAFTPKVDLATVARSVAEDIRHNANVDGASAQVVNGETIVTIRPRNRFTSEISIQFPKEFADAWEMTKLVNQIIYGGPGSYKSARVIITFSETAIEPLVSLESNQVIGRGVKTTLGIASSNGIVGTLAMDDVLGAQPPTIRIFIPFQPENVSGVLSDALARLSQRLQSLGVAGYI